MKSRVVLFGLVAFLTSGLAHAHHYTIHFQHLVRLHAPGEAQGQQVVAAVTRVGVLAHQMPNHPGWPGTYTPPFWAGEQTVHLTRVGDHFFGKTRLSVTEYPFGPTMGPVLEETTLHLANGDTVVLRGKVVKVEAVNHTSTLNDYNEALAAALTAYNEAADATESVCWTVSLLQKEF